MRERMGEQMKIAQVAPLTEAVPPKLYGGTERIVSYLTDELVALGHDVTLFASGDSITAAKLEAGLAAGAAARPAHPRLASRRICADAGDGGATRRRVRRHPSACRLSRLFRPEAPRRAVPGDAAWPARPDGAAAALRRSSTTSRWSRSRIPSASRCRRPNYVATVYHGSPSTPCVPGVRRRRLSRLPRPHLAGKGAGRGDPHRRQGRQCGSRSRPRSTRSIASISPSRIEPLLAQPHVEFIGEIGDDAKSEFLGNAAGAALPDRLARALRPRR